MVNSELAERAKPIFSRCGIDMETAVNVYLMQVVAGIDILSHGQEKTACVRPPMQFDCLKGVLDIDGDFSDVLADFKDYM
jgi:hypothetical protein